MIKKVTFVLATLVDVSHIVVCIKVLTRPYIDKLLKVQIFK